MLILISPAKTLTRFRIRTKDTKVLDATIRQRVIGTCGFTGSEVTRRTRKADALISRPSGLERNEVSRLGTGFHYR